MAGLVLDEGLVGPRVPFGSFQQLDQHDAVRICKMIRLSFGACGATALSACSRCNPSQRADGLQHVPGWNQSTRGHTACDASRRRRATDTAKPRMPGSGVEK